MDGALGAGRLVAHQVPQESPAGKVEEKEQDMTRVQVVVQVVTYAGTRAPSTCTCV